MDAEEVDVGVHDDLVPRSRRGLRPVEAVADGGCGKVYACVGVALVGRRFS